MTAARAVRTVTPRAARSSGWKAAPQVGRTARTSWRQASPTWRPGGQGGARRRPRRPDRPGGAGLAPGGRPPPGRVPTRPSVAASDGRLLRRVSPRGPVPARAAPGGRAPWAPPGVRRSRRRRAPARVRLRRRWSGVPGLASRAPVVGVRPCDRRSRYRRHRRIPLGGRSANVVPRPARTVRCGPAEAGPPWHGRGCRSARPRTGPYRAGHAGPVCLRCPRLRRRLPPAPRRVRDRDVQARVVQVLRVRALRVRARDAAGGPYLGAPPPSGRRVPVRTAAIRRPFPGAPVVRSSAHARRAWRPGQPGLSAAERPPEGRTARPMPRRAGSSGRAARAVAPECAGRRALRGPRVTPGRVAGSARAELRHRGSPAGPARAADLPLGSGRATGRGSPAPAPAVRGPPWGGPRPQPCPQTGRHRSPCVPECLWACVGLRRSAESCADREATKERSVTTSLRCATATRSSPDPVAHPARARDARRGVS
ncbi:hypothetical protein BX265_2313 [Streptomyces sp. TLI_235]|nr:hypothetical protein BX265_2313 [Streptomyces sp. TLI_235]